MADSFRISIDLERLRADLGNRENSIWTIPEVKKWLRAHLFIEDGDEWICEEIQLSLLAPEEILNVEEL